MNQMLGMSPEQVRAKASILRTQLSVLESAANTVNAAALSSLPATTALMDSLKAAGLSVPVPPVSAILSAPTPLCMAFGSPTFLVSKSDPVVEEVAANEDFVCSIDFFVQRMYRQQLCCLSPLATSFARL